MEEKGGEGKEKGRGMKWRRDECPLHAHNH